MIVKIIDPKKDGKKLYQNAGSCLPLIKYLSKEDERLGEDREYFFNHDKDVVFATEVYTTIDKYRKGLERSDTKFYSLVIAPTEKEISSLKDPVKEMRSYTRQIMNIYAECFNGINGPKNLKGEDIEYFAKIEFDRYYKGTDKEVLNGDIEQGTPKPGNNMHVHIVVSRKDKSNTFKISPLVKNKKLFHIEGYKLKSCYKFTEIYFVNNTAQELEKNMIDRYKNDNDIRLYESYKPKISKDMEEAINRKFDLKNKQLKVSKDLNTNKIATKNVDDKLEQKKEKKEDRPFKRKM